MDHDNSPVKEEEYFNEMSSNSSSKGSEAHHREIKDKTLKIKGSRIQLEKK